MAGLGHIDTHVATKRPSKSAPPLPSPRFSKRSAITAVAAIAAVMLLIVVGKAVGNPLPSKPESIVSDFFTHIQDGDAEEALLLMHSFPTGEAGRFLTRDALGNDGWEVTRVEEADGEDDERRSTDVTIGDGDDEQRFVDVTIDGPDGEVDSTVELDYVDDEGWRISSELYQVMFEPSSLRYSQINDVIAPRYSDQAYYLLPGIYDFYPSNESVRTRQAPQMVTFDDPTAELITSTGLTVSKKGTEAIQQEVETLIDGCLTYATLSPDGCPFGLDEYMLGKNEDVHTLRDLSWDVVEYPATDVVTDSSGYLDISTTESGTVEVTGTNIDTDKPFSKECEMNLDGSSVYFASDGTPSVKLSSETCRYQD